MSDRTSTVFRRLTGLALGVALCAGCTASGGEKPTEPASTGATSEAATAEPSPSATPVPVYDGTAAPVMPADMASDGHLGARAAATYLFEVRNWAIVSGDTTLLDRLCDPASIFCSQSLSLVLDEASNSIRSSGGLVDFTIAEVLPPNDEHAFYEVRGSLNQDPVTRTSSSGEILEVTQGASELPYVVFVEYLETGSWIVRGADMSS